LECRPKGAVLDDNTAKHLETHRTLHAKGRSWQTYVKFTPHDPKRDPSLPESMLSRDLYIYEKLGKAQPKQLETLVYNLLGKKVPPKTIHQTFNDFPRISSNNAYEKLSNLTAVIGKLEPTKRVLLKDLVPDSAGSGSFGQFVTRKLTS